ncbi:MBL fold metallo-hydrolase [Polymorphum gilvum]|uniref:Metallo-beta-lactamase superfamily protein n=1 Tax=Polymorphum gilvum (strain LMG 25793 / CGMCC 1.9160 / SL003B-26A1) TaxID=991905 RepID=F2IY93_POLGS|nr:MBL fold metallo-hydrolase [Polymorphum gilvum]ADZ71705.1 Metallo-beta-lactamase superfamily protein [Polymorphum gilvum SL003B-26A1]
MAKLIHDRSFDPRHGEAVEVADGVRRLTVANPGPFTFHGTNTYLVGERDVVVIDPGPQDAPHLDAILRATAGARIAAILVSHTHKDHSPAAADLRARTGAPVYGCGPHRAARGLALGEINPLDASCDLDYRPDRVLVDGERITLGGAVFEAVETPGHTANHLAFALPDEGILFSADHVMVWSTSIVAPPDGSMQAYMDSLDKLLARSEDLYFPGHGGPVRAAADYVTALKVHRHDRERAILDALGRGPGAIRALVDTIYKGLDPALKPAAALSVFAQIENLVDRGLVACAGTPTLNSEYRLT